MSRPPPRSTRTYTLFPYTTLFRAVVAYEIACANAQIERIFGIDAGDTVAADARDTISAAEAETALDGEDDLVRGLVVISCAHPGAAAIVRDRKSTRVTARPYIATRPPSPPPTHPPTPPPPPPPP